MVTKSSLGKHSARNSQLSSLTEHVEYEERSEVGGAVRDVTSLTLINMATVGSMLSVPATGTGRKLSPSLKGTNL